RAGEAGVVVYLQEQPAGVDEERLQLGDFERVAALDGRVLVLADRHRGQPRGRRRGYHFTAVHDGSSLTTRLFTFRAACAKRKQRSLPPLAFVTLNGQFHVVVL